MSKAKKQIFCLTQSYKDYIKNNNLKEDNHQKAIIALLDSFSIDIIKTHTRKKLSFFKSSVKSHKQGFYIYGDVGRGKSLIMKLFLDEFTKNHPSIKTKYLHFNEFMKTIHASLNAIKVKDSEDKISIIAKQFSKQVNLLCFDEFQINDIADAMIIGRLFEALLKFQVFIISTSNIKPQDLYKEGLQRDRFLPFIEIINKNMHVVSLDGNIDYRLLCSLIHSFKHSDKYFVADSKTGENFIKSLFFEKINFNSATACNLNVEGRKVKFFSTYENSVLVSYNELFQKPLAANDYMAFCAKFNNIYLYHLPNLTDENQDEVKRLILFIDQAYEHKANLHISADLYFDKIYSGSKKAFEFKRAISRIKQLCT